MGALRGVVASTAYGRGEFAALGGYDASVDGDAAAGGVVETATDAGCFKSSRDSDVAAIDDEGAYRYSTYPCITNATAVNDEPSAVGCSSVNGQLLACA